jgi:hypothetical protein
MMRHPIVATGFVLCILLGPQASKAMWAELSESSLIEQSELIVTGTLLSRTQVSVPSAALELHLAVIQIDTVLKGDPSQRAVLLVLPAPTPGFHHSGTITYVPGQTGLWYLRIRAKNESGLFLADHPQRFVPTERAAEPIGRIKKRLAR